MADLQDVPLLSGFTGGINRASAGHLLQPNELAEAFDCALYGDQPGILGPRRGRVRNSKYAANVVGVTPLSLPIGDYWVIATNDGVIQTLVGVTPNPNTSPLLNGWTRVNPGTLTAAQTGTGTTNGTSYPHAGVDLSTVKIVYGDVTVQDLLQANTNDAYTEGTVNLQAEINGSWTTLLTLRVDQTAMDYQVETVAIPTSGTLTGWRVSTTVSAGSGTIQGVYLGDIFLVYGSEQGTL